VPDPDHLSWSQKGLHLFKYLRLSVTVVEYHTIAYLLWPRQWLFLWVELCDLSGNNDSLKAFYISNSKNVWSGSKKMGPIFHKLRTV